MKIFRIFNIDKVIVKQEVAQEVLKDLPEWFGIDEATVQYIEQVKKYPFFAVYKRDEIVGFYSLREENKDTLDMFVLGIKKKYHHQGIGTMLHNYVLEYARAQKYKYLMVLTLSKEHKDTNYKVTRAFYHKLGFVDLYQSDKIWGKESPTQVMVLKL